MSTRTNLARNLAALMAHHKMSQGDVHRKCGVAQSTIGRILREESAADVDTLTAIAGVFSLAAWQLITPPFEPSNPPVINQVSPQERDLYERLRSILQNPPKG